MTTRSGYALRSTVRRSTVVIDPPLRVVRGYRLHAPDGFQSEGMPLCCAESWMTRANARRTVGPVTFSSIGIFDGTVIVPPARALLAPAGVSRHCSPANTYQPS